MLFLFKSHPKILSTFFALIMLTITACASHGEHGIQKAQNVAKPAGFQRTIFQTSSFDIFGYKKIGNPANKTATLYIEGDGFAWRTRTRPSLDPTPLNPFILQLATLDPAETIIYLARPCQYIHSKKCAQKYWTSHRAAPEIVNTYRNILEQLHVQYGFENFNLVGYSGGATLALLLGAQAETQERHITSIRTIAGNLSPQYHSQYHNVDPQFGSLEPLHYKAVLSNIPQTHYFGARDTIVPPAIGEYYKQQFHDQRCIQNIVIPDATHNKGWIASWGNMASKPVECLGKTMQR